MNEQKESEQFKNHPRRYTLAEIDEMRLNLGWLMDGQSTAYSGGTCYINPPSKSDIEMRLRTYLLVGIDPQEIKDEYKKVSKQREQKRLEIVKAITGK